MIADNFGTTEEVDDYNLWEFNQGFHHIANKEQLKQQAGQLGLDLLATNNLSSNLFHDDGVCIRDDLVLDRKLVLIDNCTISASKIIECNNCIFTGNVHILLEDTDCNPVIRNSIFLGKLNILISKDFPKKSARPSLEITNCLVNILNIQSSRLSLLNIHGSVFRSAKFFDSEILNFRVRANKFCSLSFVGFSADHAYFGPDQIPLNPIIEPDPEHAALPLKFADLAHIKKHLRLGKNENSTKGDTLEFLLREADLRTNLNTKAHLKYLQLIERSPHRVIRYAIWLSGGLLKPYRLLACSMLCILMYAILYRINIDQLSSAKNYWDCLYFSAISFTTIGFGDITPTGFARFLAVSEGLAGVIFSSSLVASIIRKYTE